MPSTLAWLDHDTTANERTKRILALFQERGTIDQLGLGAIRDSFSDLLFPGTSTIQTRLRYFLIVPWVYRDLEDRQVPSRRAAAEARERELALVAPLLAAREEGVFGSSAGTTLKILPSAIYWGGLRIWGIRRFDLTRAQYHQGMDELHRARSLARRQRVEEGADDRGPTTWHSDLPPAPDGFPDRLTLSLERPEADFLRDRIVAAHPGSLLAWLALNAQHTAVDFPWDHPAFLSMEQEHRRILEHARIFSQVMSGAPILYNLMLCELANRSEVGDHRQTHEEWCAALDRDALAEWDVDDLFGTARGQGGHTITPQAEDFVRRWIRMARSDPEVLLEDEDARQLIERRERLLKGSRSLFKNQRARDERYQGSLGMGRMQFRWPQVQTLLNDLHEGLEAA